MSFLSVNGGFGALRQVEAGVLNVGYLHTGPNNGPVAVLLHGWPYDIHSFGEVAPLLTAEGHRVIVPYLRGTARRASCPTRRFATANKLHSQSM
jgi:pimeloyl-ACP methyl ester carboxylesterase